MKRHGRYDAISTMCVIVITGLIGKNVYEDTKHRSDLHCKDHCVCESCFAYRWQRAKQ